MEKIFPKSKTKQKRLYPDGGRSEPITIRIVNHPRAAITAGAADDAAPPRNERNPVAAGSCSSRKDPPEPKRTMSTDQRHANHHSRNENRSNIREENHEDAEQDQAPERLAIGEGTTQDNNRLIGGAEEVEEEPRGEAEARRRGASRGEPTIAVATAR
ncbi:hypothetical protein Bca52824_003696 [Brassica carinata]|uniref:Uncharacterized protein n=1 Tax=Brassica carinata TaxID=52824 RepID=A0A8X7WMK1_BRACI|nr:hypothetical protein Bca52824_003696 [Brassica carinata]